MNATICSTALENERISEMLINASVVHYVLSESFPLISVGGSMRSLNVDYPLLFAGNAALDGHVAIVAPDCEATVEKPSESVLYVCFDEGTAERLSTLKCNYIQLSEKVSYDSVFNSLQATFMKFERLDVRLRACVSGHEGFGMLLDACSTSSGCAFVLIDDQFRAIARSVPDQKLVRAFNTSSKHASVAAPPASEELEADAIDLFMASRRYQHIRSSRKVFAVPGSEDLFMKNIFAGSVLVGSLAARHEGTKESASFVRYLLDYLAQFVSMMYGDLGSFGVADERSVQVKQGLIDASSGDSQAAARLERALIDDGHDSQAEYVILLVERSFTNEEHYEEGYLANRLESSLPHAHSFPYKGRLYVLADTFTRRNRASASFFDEIPVVARENLVRMAVSRSFSSMEWLGAAIMQADIAFEQGNAIHPTSWLYRFESYALGWLVAHARGDAIAETVCHPAIIALEKYDAQHQGNLVETMETFMRCRYSATSAAEKLFIARSTLLNRLERIRELTGVTFDDYDERLYLALSLALIKGAR